MWVMEPRPQPRIAAVVLAGGTAVRLDGADKASVEVDGRTLLEHALDALTDTDEVVVVMPTPVPTSRPVTVVCEDPPYGGPAAGLLAGTGALLRPADLVVVLAVDMPWVTPATVRRLREAAAGHDGAFLVDTDGRRQLAGVLDGPRLAAVSPGPEDRHGMALHRLLDPLDLVDVPAQDRESRDVDTWEDLREEREEHGPDHRA
jgi:molybdopterin-guanine dinucleotide biosynthesis protein A